MRISATGSSAAERRRGFTLLEIMLVLALMAIATLWVVPNLVTGRDGDMANERRHLVSLLRLSAEEAQLTGEVVRCTLTRNGYHFSRRSSDGAWLPMRQAPFLPYQFSDSRHAMQIELIGTPSLSRADQREAASAQLLFYPDGALTIADIVMGDGSEQLRIRLRPGPGGIGSVG